MSKKVTTSTKYVVERLILFMHFHAKCRRLMAILSLVAIPAVITAIFSVDKGPQEKTFLLPNGSRLDHHGTACVLSLHLGCPDAASLRSVLARAECPHIEVVEVFDGEVNQSQLDFLIEECRPSLLALRGVKLSGIFSPARQIRGVQRIWRLDLSDSVFLSPAHCDLSHLVALRSVSIQGTNLGDATLRTLRNIDALRRIEADDSQVGDGILALTQSRTLERLSLRGTSVSDEDIVRLQLALPKLTIDR